MYDESLNLTAINVALDTSSTIPTVDAGPLTVAYIIILIISIALSIVSLLLAPKPPKPKSASLDDFTFPTADQDRSIPVLFGTRRVRGPNVVWYGDLRADPKYNDTGGKK